MGKLRRLALASLEICSYIGRVAIQFSMHLRNSALNNRMCLWVQRFVESEVMFDKTENCREDLGTLAGEESGMGKPWANVL
jgi:hypothetical protein